MTIAANALKAQTPPLRPEALAAPDSGIVEVFHHGFGREGLIPLWAGEGDLPTPSFISDAASRALAAGETFYTKQRGIPELRQAIATLYEPPLRQDPLARALLRDHRGHARDPDRDASAAGSRRRGRGALPRLAELHRSARRRRAKPVLVPMHLADGRWHLDLDKLAAAITPRTRVIVINSPANPTGWTATGEELAGGPRARAKARAVDRRRRDLWPFRLWPVEARPLLP